MLRWFSICNHGRGSTFTQFHGSAAKQAALARGARILELRPLHEAAMRRIDAHDASFWAAINHRGSDKALGMMDRQRVKVWLHKTHEDLAAILG